MMDSEPMLTLIGQRGIMITHWVFVCYLTHIENVLDTCTTSKAASKHFGSQFKFFDAVTFPELIY